VERLQAALEKFKQQHYSGHDGAAMGRPQPARHVPSPIIYTTTRSVEVPESVLGEHRILTGLERGPFVDGFKILRTQVMHRLRENGWNLLALTSPGHGEGKTLTAINLAVALAMETSQTVLLVDADLRNPSVQRVFDLGECPGLTEYLFDDVPIQDLLIHPGIGRLVLLPGGRAIQNSAEALSSQKMAALVDELKHRYQSRVVVFDLPPLLHRADALAFTPYVEAMLLVIEEGRTTIQDVTQALDLIKTVTPVLGTVLNKAGRNGISPKAMKRLLSA